MFNSLLSYLHPPLTTNAQKVQFVLELVLYQNLFHTFPLKVNVPLKYRSSEEEKKKRYFKSI